MSYEPYIKVEDGLTRCAGNKKLFAKLLKSFGNYASSFAQIKDEINAGEQEKAKETVHSLKGITGNLSLNLLYEKLVAIESGMKEGIYDVAPVLELEQDLVETQTKIELLISEFEAV